MIQDVDPSETFLEDLELTVLALLFATARCIPSRLSQIIPSNRDYPVQILAILARPRTCLLGNSRPQDTSIELQPVTFEQSPLTAVGAE